MGGFAALMLVLAVAVMLWRKYSQSGNLQMEKESESVLVESGSSDLVVVDK